MKLKLKSWWGPGAAVFCVVVFGGLAGLPLLKGVARAVAKGEPLTLAAVVEETKKENHEKEKDKPEKLREFKSAARLENGTRYLGTKAGLLVQEGERWNPVADGPADEAKSLAVAGNTLWIAGKEGIYEIAGGQCKRVKDGDFHSVSVNPDGTVLAVTKTAVHARDAQGVWAEWKVDLGHLPMPEKKEKQEKKEMKEDKDKY